MHDRRALRTALADVGTIRGTAKIAGVSRNTVYPWIQTGKIKVTKTRRGLREFNIITHESLLEAGLFVETIEKRQGLRVACLEAIAYENGWLSADDLRRIGAVMSKNGYGQYLLQLAGQSA
mgnify:CR=1 FL=1